MAATEKTMKEVLAVMKKLLQLRLNARTENKVEVKA